MRNFISPAAEQKKTPPVKLLISCLMSGWLLITLLFAFFRPQIHHMIDPIL